MAYNKSVADAAGGAGKAYGAYRWFNGPGMAHCGGGEGPNEFDLLTALE